MYSITTHTPGLLSLWGKDCSGLFKEGSSAGDLFATCIQLKVAVIAEEGKGQEERVDLMQTAFSLFEVKSSLYNFTDFKARTGPIVISLSDLLQNAAYEASPSDFGACISPVPRCNEHEIKRHQKAEENKCARHWISPLVTSPNAASQSFPVFFFPQI